MRSPYEFVYAVVRVDDYGDGVFNPETQITVKEVVWSREEAEKEVKRLNALGLGRYYFTLSRLVTPATITYGRLGGDLLKRAKRAAFQLSDIVTFAVKAEWDVAEIGYSLTLTELAENSSGTAVFAENDSDDVVRNKLLRLWGDLLQTRSHKQLARLMEL